jgi:tetraacyldisaccharide 4'-kinase
MELLANEDERRSLAQNAREALDSQRGAIQRTLEKLSSLLTSPAHERTAEMDFPTWIYATWVHARNDGYDHRILRSRALTRPVISVGNLSVGGSGKTPFVILLGELLKQRGIPFDVLSRGYGRESRGVLAVNPEGSALDFGDEPILIAKRLRCPVVVGESRYEAGLFAEKNFSAQVHILDDGFQHRFLVRDLEIVLLTSEDLVDRLLPAGRLREPISALDRAHVVVLPEEMSMSPPPGKTIWRIRRSIGIPQVPARPVAFCGIAKPNRFIEQLRQAGVEIAAQRFYRDHHAYTADDVRDLLALREEKNAGGFVTTEKDAINLGLHYGQLTPLTVAHVRLELLNPADALDTLLRVIAEHQPPA